MYLKDIKAVKENPVKVCHKKEPDMIYEWDGDTLYECIDDIIDGAVGLQYFMLNDGWSLAPMSPKAFEKEMKKLAKDKDTEASHSNMDGLMCEVLTQLGYGKGVAVFASAKKYYS